MKKIILLPLLSLYLSVTAQTTGEDIRYPNMGDIVISEIMADPNPSHGLPEREYLEITNRTAETLQIGGILLIAGKDSARLNEGVIMPQEYIILCSTASSKELLAYGQVMAVKSFPTLRNDGDLLALRNPDGTLIHAVNYTSGFLGDGIRSGGGWSAELTDLANPFNEPFVWAPSEDPSGGTPGRANSLSAEVADNRSPRVIAVWPVNSETLAVLFDETVVVPAAVPWSLDGRTTFPALSGDHGDRTLLVRLATPLRPGEIVSLMIPPAITDFAGNVPVASYLKTGLPDNPLAGEILFNELMPDPVAGCPEYIELYNNSGKIFDLSTLYLAGTSGSASAITATPRQMLPGDYLALSAGGEVLLNCHPCAAEESLFTTARIPALPNDKGRVTLYDRNLNVIDMVEYNKGMHLLFLSGSKGVALEKVSPQLPSDPPGNWHSASESCNWATPGAPNSVLTEIVEDGDGLVLSGTRISPDSDGFEDIISIGVFPGGDDNLISVTLFNDRGYPVRKLAERVSAGSGTTFIWDGLAENGVRLSPGLYIVIAESYNTAGRVRRWKSVCALLYR